jgi:DNA repair ATPase RecN
MRKTYKIGCGETLLVFVIIALSAVGSSLAFYIALPLLIFILANFLLSYVGSKTGRKLVENEGLEGMVVSFPTATNDASSHDVHTQYAALLKVLDEHKNHPIVLATEPEIRREAANLKAETEHLFKSRERIQIALESRRGSRQDAQNLELQIQSEENPRVKQVLESTLERKKNELENVDKLSENLRYVEGLIQQAAATMSELKSKIDLALTETDAYANPRVQLAVDEANRELRSVSDAMRDTLQELDATN